MKRSGKADADKKLEILRQEVARIAPLAKGDVAVSVAEPGGQPIPLLNGDRMSSLASAFKVAVALALLHDVQNGKLELDQLIELLPGDYSLNAVLDKHLPTPGSRISVRNLMFTMITDSDNTAADCLMRVVGGPQVVTSYIHSLGVKDIRIDRYTRELGFQLFEVKNMQELNVKFAELGKDPYAMAAVWTGRSEAFEKDPRDRITSTNIFDGSSERLAEGMSVLVEGNKIAKIAKSIPAPAGATVIDAAGRTLMPGFIDAHVHLTLQFNIAKFTSSDESQFALAGAKESREMLLRGFTSARDTGGNTYSLKRAIDEGWMTGPRIYPSGAGIGQTGGHGDYRPLNAVLRPQATEAQAMERVGTMVIADGPVEVMIAAREQLRKGASQIKISTGGGVASQNDPLDVVQYTPEEVRAAVDAARNWNTYVAAHVYNITGIRIALENGVKSLDHAFFIDEPMLDLAIEKDAWLSVQTLGFVETPGGMDAGQIARFAQARQGLDTMFALVKKKGFKKIAFGTDVIGDPELMARQNEEFTIRTKWFSNFEVLRQATSGNAQLLALSGPRNPYPGKLGVIEEGAYADLLLINGDPLKDISILTKPEENLALIMKDGKIYKNTVQQ